MLDLLLLLLFAKMQDHVYEEAPAWKWALACSAVIIGKSWFLKSAGMGAETTLVAVAIAFVMLFFYAWGYFAILRQVGDSLLLWLLVFFGGAILPFLLSVWAISPRKSRMTRPSTGTTNGLCLRRRRPRIAFCPIGQLNVLNCF